MVSPNKLVSKLVNQGFLLLSLCVGIIGTIDIGVTEEEINQMIKQNMGPGRFILFEDTRRRKPRASTTPDFSTEPIEIWTGTRPYEFEFELKPEVAKQTRVKRESGQEIVAVEVEDGDPGSIIRIDRNPPEEKFSALSHVVDYSKMQDLEEELIAGLEGYIQTPRNTLSLLDHEQDYASLFRDQGREAKIYDAMPYQQCLSTCHANQAVMIFNDDDARELITRVQQQELSIWIKVETRVEEWEVDERYMANFPIAEPTIDGKDVTRICQKTKDSLTTMGILAWSLPEKTHEHGLVRTKSAEMILPIWSVKFPGLSREQLRWTQERKHLNTKDEAFLTPSQQEGRRLKQDRHYPKLAVLPKAAEYEGFRNRTDCYVTSNAGPGWTGPLQPNCCCVRKRTSLFLKERSDVEALDRLAQIYQSPVHHSTTLEELAAPGKQLALEYGAGQAVLRQRRFAIGWFVGEALSLMVPIIQEIAGRSPGDPSLLRRLIDMTGQAIFKSKPASRPVIAPDQLLRAQPLPRELSHLETRAQPGKLTISPTLALIKARKYRLSAIEDTLALQTINKVRNDLAFTKGLLNSHNAGELVPALSQQTIDRMANNGESITQCESGIFPTEGKNEQLLVYKTLNNRKRHKTYSQIITAPKYYRQEDDGSYSFPGMAKSCREYLKERTDEGQGGIQCPAHSRHLNQVTQFSYPDEGKMFLRALSQGSVWYEFLCPGQLPHRMEVGSVSLIEVNVDCDVKIWGHHLPLKHIKAKIGRMRLPNESAPLGYEIHVNSNLTRIAKPMPKEQTSVLNGVVTAGAAVMVVLVLVSVIPCCMKCRRKTKEDPSEILDPEDDGEAGFEENFGKDFKVDVDENNNEEE